MGYPNVCMNSGRSPWLSSYHQVQSTRVEAAERNRTTSGTIEGDVTLNLIMEGGMSSAQEWARCTSCGGRIVSESTETSA